MLRKWGRFKKQLNSGYFIKIIISNHMPVLYCPYLKLPADFCIYLSLYSIYKDFYLFPRDYGFVVLKRQILQYLYQNVIRWKFKKRKYLFNFICFTATLLVVSFFHRFDFFFKFSFLYIKLQCRSPIVVPN